MSKGIAIGTFTSNESLEVDASGFAAWSYMLELNGAFGGGRVLAESSPDGGATYVPVKVMDTETGLFVNFDTPSIRGAYPLEIIASHLRFTLSGATSPTLIATLFPRPRA